MPTPIVAATSQATALACVSNILAQILDHWRNGVSSAVLGIEDHNTDNAFEGIAELLLWRLPPLSHSHGPYGASQLHVAGVPGAHLSRPYPNPGP